MSKLTLQTWERKFRRDAQADKLGLFMDHLRNLELEQETTPELMLEGTILAVSACCAYASIDGQLTDAFLAAQTYDPAQSAASTYSFTFDLCGKSTARLLVSEDLKIPDLADLFGHPWDEYQVCGYRNVLITRLDGEWIKDDEDSRLEKLVTADLMFDYCEGEIEISCDSSYRAGSLCVWVRDC
jgi:hypothetical protein